MKHFFGIFLMPIHIILVFEKKRWFSSAKWSLSRSCIFFGVIILSIYFFCTKLLSKMSVNICGNITHTEVLFNCTLTALIHVACTFIDYLNPIFFFIFASKLVKFSKMVNDSPNKKNVFRFSRKRNMLVQSKKKRFSASLVNSPFIRIHKAPSEFWIFPSVPMYIQMLHQEVE